MQHISLYQHMNTYKIHIHNQNKPHQWINQWTQSLFQISITTQQQFQITLVTRLKLETRKTLSSSFRRPLSRKPTSPLCFQTWKGQFSKSIIIKYTFSKNCNSYLKQPQFHLQKKIYQVILSIQTHTHLLIDYKTKPLD